MTSQSKWSTAPVVNEIEEAGLVDLTAEVISESIWMLDYFGRLHEVEDMLDGDVLL